MTQPILSICLPTYNRASLLDSAIHNLIPLLDLYGDEIEIIICDNASTDETPQIIERMCAGTAIRTYRNDENLGFYGSYFRMTGEWARGEFCWVLGDDDIVRAEGVGRILQVIKGNSDVDYIYANTTMLKHVERLNREQPIHADEFPSLEPLKSHDLSERVVKKWETLIDPAIDEVFLGAVQISVFRLSRWREVLNSLEIDPDQGHRINYFNTELLARSYLGRKAYYLGYPCTVAFSGGQDWVTFHPILMLVLLQDMLDTYIEVGVPIEIVERCRTVLLERSTEAVRAILTQKNIKRREQFSWSKFLWRNRRQGKHLLNLLTSIFEPDVPIFEDRLHDYSLAPHQHLDLSGDLPLVSVIVMSSEESVLETVKQQTYTTHEIIQVDTDGSLEATLESASGKYIAFIDNNARWNPEKLAIQVSYLETYPEVGLCYSSYETIDDSTTTYIPTNEFGGRCFYHILRDGQFLPASTLVIRREALNQSTTYHPELGHLATINLSLQVIRNHPIAMTSKPLTQIIVDDSPNTFEALTRVQFWQAIIDTDQALGWRFRRKKLKMLYYLATRELYAHWPTLPEGVTKRKAGLIALNSITHMPSSVFRPEIPGLIVRAWFPQKLYERLQPIWRRVLRVKG